MSDVIPDGWILKSVGELSNVKRGASPRPIKDSKWWGGDIGWVRISDVTSSRKYLSKTTQYLSDEGVGKSVQIPKGEVVLSICATIGRPIIINIDACIHDGFVWFDKLNKNISREYWYYFLASKEEFLGSQRQSGTQGNLNTSIVADLICPLPPLPEQQKIAAILSSVDEVIEKTQAQIRKLKDLKTGMMQELLSPREPKAGDQTGAQSSKTNGLHHTEFKDSPLGRIPVGWGVVKIADLQAKEKYSCVGGPFGSDLTSKHYIDEIGVPVIRGANLSLTAKRFTDTNFVYVSESKADSLARNMAYPGDFVFTQRGTMGQVGLIPDHAKFKRYVVSQSQMKLTIDESIIDKDFLYQYFLSNIFLKSLDLETIATGLPHINLGILKSFNIPLPSMQEQKEIRVVLNSMDNKSALLLGRQEKYINIKKALMQDLLTGKVRVSIN